MHRFQGIIIVAILAVLLIGLAIYFQPFLHRVDTDPGQPDRTGTSPETSLPGQYVEATPSPAPPVLPTAALDAEPVAEAMPGPSSEDLPVQSFRVYGMVIDAATDAPVTGALLTVTPPVEGVEAVQTGPDGAYEMLFDLPGHAPDTKLRCSAPGYQANSKAVVSGPQPVETEVDDTPTELRLDYMLQAGSSIAGQVRDAKTGEPVAGVRLTAIPAGGGFMMQMTFMDEPSLGAMTDDAGAYVIDGLEPASYRVNADGSSAGYIMDAAASKTVAIPEDATEAKADFQLTLGGTVRGNVTTSEGPAGDGLEVRVMPVGGLAGLTSNMFSGGPNPMMAFRPIRAEYGEAGAYSAKGLVFDKDYRVTATAEGFASASSETFRVSTDAPEARVNLTLQRGSTISGKAVYEDGTPAHERKLMLLPDYNNMMRGDLAAGMGDHRQEADEQGLFVFTGLVAGKYTLMAEPDEDRRFDLIFGGGDNRLPIEVDGVTDVTGVKLVLKRPTNPDDGEEADGFIEGSVIGPDGRPAVGVTVTATAEVSGFDPASMMTGPSDARTDENGFFRIDDLAKPRYALHVKSLLGNVEKTGVAVDSKVTLRLDPPTRLRGQVVDAARKGVAGCKVTLEPEAPEGFDFMALMGMGGGGEDTRETDEFGFFEFENATPGTYTLKAVSRASGTGETAPFDVVPGNDMMGIEIVLTPGVAFSGRVLDSAGAPVENATVSLQPAAEGVAGAMSQFLPAAMRSQAGSAQSGPDGAYELLRVPPGTYTVSATHASFSPTTVKDVIVAAGQDVRGFDLVLLVGGCVEGVTILQGEARSGIMVQVMGEGGMFMATSDEEGKFEICAIPEGFYLAQAVDAGSMMGGDLSNMQFKQVSVEVVNGQTTTVNFAPPENTSTLSGQVGGNLGTMTQVTLRRPGGPAPEDLDPLDMQAQMQAASFQAGTALVDAQGTFTMEGVEAGEYLLEVYSFTIDPTDLQTMMEMDRTPQIRQEVQVEAGKDQHLELTLP